MSDHARPLLQADLAMGLTHAPRRREQGPSEGTAEPTARTMPVRPTRLEPAPTDVIATPAVQQPSEAKSAPASARPQAPVEAAASALRVPASLGSQPMAAVEGRDARQQALAALQARHDRECPHCTTSTSHTNTVFGEGDPLARLMFIGEAPGETEDRLGRPFVGRAGEKLDEMIRAMGLDRAQVYIANVLKSRPPDNRTPLQHEVDACGPYLIEQILLIRPQVIVTLGGPATKLLLGTETGITRLRGTWAAWQPPAGSADPIPVMPTYHPAYLLRNYTPKTRAEVWNDLQAVMQRLGITRA